MGKVITAVIVILVSLGLGLGLVTQEDADADRPEEQSHFEELLDEYDLDEGDVQAQLFYECGHEIRLLRHENDTRGERRWENTSRMEVEGDGAGPRGSGQFSLSSGPGWFWDCEAETMRQVPRGDYEFRVLPNLEHLGGEEVRR